MRSMFWDVGAVPEVLDEAAVHGRLGLGAWWHRPWGVSWMVAGPWPARAG